MGIYEEKPANISLDVFKDEKLMNESLLYFEFLSHTYVFTYSSSSM